MIQTLKLKTILLDMDGVLWHGPEPVLNLGLLFERIRDQRLQAYCVTNNSTRTISSYLDKLARFGVRLEPASIITSAEATADFLAAEFPQSGAVYVIGEDGIKFALQERGFQILPDDNKREALAVVVGLDRKFTYQKLAQAVRFIHRGALFLGTNPDLTFPTPSDVAPGAGSIIKGIEACSGVEPQIIGKPYPLLYSLALKRANSLPEETLMIGDRLETDILGAQQMGLMTAVVLSGISNREQAEAWHPRPNLIAEDALQVIEMIGKSNG